MKHASSIDHSLAEALFEEQFFARGTVGFREAP